MTGQEIPIGSRVIYAVADFTHIPWEIIAMLTPFAAVALYVLFIVVLFAITNKIVDEFRCAEGWEKFFTFFPMVVLCTVVILIEIIHGVAFLLMGRAAMNNARDWWHDGARRH